MQVDFKLIVDAFEDAARYAENTANYKKADEYRTILEELKELPELEDGQEHLIEGIK